MRLALFVLSWCCLFPSIGSSHPLILSEFLANNERGLKDEDGAVSDWIEIQNVTTNTVSTAGWSLTDSTANLRKWILPATNVPPQGFLVVFASAKDRALPGKPLHTNFKLDAGASGEYLALIKPDGVTIATEYRPTYPQQFPDVSYGLGSRLTTTLLAAPNAPGKVRVPTDGAVGLQWTERGFADGDWTAAQQGLGYDTGVVDPLEDSAAVAVLGSQPLAFYRLNESGGTVAANAGSLGATADAALSGTAVNGAAGPEAPAYKGYETGNKAFRPGTAGGLRVPANAAFNFGTGPFAIELWFLTPDPNTRGDLVTLKGPKGDFGIQLSSQTGRRISVFHNTFLGNGGTVATNQWQHLVVTRDEARTTRAFLNGTRIVNATHNTDMSIGTDLLIGSNHTGDPGSPTTPFNGLIDEVAIYGRALSTNEVLAHFQAAQTFVPSSFASAITTDLRSAMLGINSSVYVRIPFAVSGAATIDRLKLRVRFDDGFVAFLNGVEVASANAPENLLWNSAATDRQPDSRALSLEEFDLNSARDLLVNGDNVLAIQGLNVGANNADFLLQAQLEATEIAKVPEVARYFPTPSPGAPNGAGLTELGPIISAPAHTPNQPKDNEDLWVTARIVSPGTPLAGATLRYRVMYGTTNEVVMLDDGQHGDGATGDGLFGAVIPAAASTNGQMVRWFITAADLAGRTSRWPLFDDPTGSPEYLGTVVFNPGVTSSIPVWEWFTTAEAATRTRSGARGSVYYGGRLYDNVFIRDRGGATTQGSQKFDFNQGDELELDENYGGIREANLNTNGQDPSFIRPVLAFETFRRVGTPACVAFNVLMRLNNKLDRTSGNGLAVFVEQVDQQFLKRNGLDTDGALYKMVQRSNLDPVFSDSRDGVEKKTRRDEPNTDLQALVDGIKLTKTPEERALYLFDNLNLPAMVNFLAVRSLIMDADDVRKNFYVYRDTNGTREWQIFPWDKDWSFGVEGDGGQHLHHPFFGDRAHSKDNADQWNVLWTVLFNDPRPREMYLRRLRTLMDQLLQPIGTPAATAFFEQRARALSALLGRAAPSSSALNVVLGYFPRRRDDLYQTYNVAGSGSPQNAVVPFDQSSAANILFGELEVSPSSGNQDEEYIQLVNPNQFAVDLSGWKVTGGIEHTFQPGTVMGPAEVMYLSPNVVAFRGRAEGPRGGQGLFVQGNYSRRLSARGEHLSLVDDHGRLIAFTTTPSTPTVGQQYLKISEIMYNPAAPALNSPFSRTDFEYVELSYTGPTPLSLAGFKFTRGIEFDFTTSSIPVFPAASAASPEVILLVKNRAAFESRYGASLRIAGMYEGSLDDSGETLRLEDSTGEVVAEFSYRDDWYRVTDGAGLALAANSSASPEFTPSSPRYWKPTAIESHRPGPGSDPTTPVVKPVFVNELLAFPGSVGLDRVELFAPEGADISGWFLTDDLQNPKKYRFPSNTVLAPGGFLVVGEELFNSGPSRFAFSSGGEEVYLVAATLDGRVLPWAHGFDFGASEAGVSFGRYLTPQGAEQFVAQQTTSFGQVNVGPRNGPVVVSEIHFHPPDLADGQDNSDDEFVELVNVSGGTVALFDDTAPTNRWEITGTIEFTFPADVSLASGRRLLLVNFAPTNAAMTAGFRQRFEVPAEVPLFGPYRGKLDNSGGRISLRKPGPVTTNGVPMILLDRVDYADDGDWSQDADGTGASLQRRAEDAYGNSSGNWIVARPTAGNALGRGAVAVVAEPPTSSLSTVLGGSFSLSVVPAGESPVSYRWRFQGQPLSGATNATLQITNVQAYHGGLYDVLVYNSAGAQLSPVTLVTVDVPTRILMSPQSRDTGPGTNVLFRVAAISGQPITYQWLKDGVELPGAQSGSLLIPVVQPIDAGTYSVRINDGLGVPLRSSNAVLRVLAKPSIVSPPQNITAVVGETVTFTTAAFGQPLPLVYRWRRNGANFLSVTNMSHSAALVLTNVQLTQAGRYSVLVTNAAGASPASADATLTVLPDTDGDGLPDDWETVNGFDPVGVKEGSLDFDGDGLSNRDEWVAGTNPKSAASRLELTLARQLDGKMSLRFSAVSNRTYSVLMRETLGGGAWNTVSNLASATSTREVQMVDPYPSSTTRYYELTTPSVPDTRPDGPTILQSPRDLSLLAGGAGEWTVVAVGQGPLRYQWFYENTLIAGATQPTFTLTNVGLGAAGHYRLVVGDQAGIRTVNLRLEVLTP